jgi:hydrogenase expression/formation protein HypE
MYVANEGKLLAVVGPDRAEAALAALQTAPGGEHACLVGAVAEEPQGMVLVRTGFGGTRIMDMLIGDPLPRIC